MLKNMKFEADQLVGRQSVQRLQTRWITALNTTVLYGAIGSGGNNKKDIDFAWSTNETRYLTICTILVLLHIGPDNHAICCEFKVHALRGFLVGSALEPSWFCLGLVKRSAEVDVSAASMI